MCSRLINYTLSSSSTARKIVSITSVTSFQKYFIEVCFDSSESILVIMKFFEKLDTNEI